MKHLKQLLAKSRGLGLVLLLLLKPGSVLAQTEEATTFWTPDAIFYALVSLLFVVAILVLIVAVYLIQVFKAVLDGGLTEEQKAAKAAEPSWLSKLWARWNDFKPVEQEGEILLDHDYDGIRELDNHLPPWWKWLFYATIVYGIGYIAVFHVFETAPLQEERYALQIEAAEAAKLAFAEEQGGDVLDENTVTQSVEPAVLIAGKEIFDERCATCHGPGGGGIAGPNLTDQYWKNGGGIKNIFATIKNGVSGTAMIPWETFLSPEKISQVSSFVMSLEGTNPPGGKAPEGELWVPEETPAEADTTATAVIVR